MGCEVVERHLKMAQPTNKAKLLLELPTYCKPQSDLEG